MKFDSGANPNGQSHPLSPLSTVPGSAHRSACALRLCTAAILLLVPASYAKQPALLFSDNADLGNCGLRIALMSDATEMPIPPPSVKTFELTRGQTRTTYEAYAPLELWIRDQFIGQWRDKFDNQLLFAVIRHCPPTTHPSSFIPLEKYREKIQPVPPFSKMTTPILTQWLAAFLKTQSVQITPVQRPPIRLANLLQVTTVPPNDRICCFAFRLNPAAAGQSRAPDNWFIALFQLAPELTANEALATITEKFLPAISVTSTTSAPKPQPVVTTSPTTRKPRSPEFQASVEQVAASISNLKDWWYAETDRFILLSNVTSKHRFMIKELQEQLEAMRSCFEIFLPPSTEIRAVSVCRVFADPDEYVRYVGPDYEWTGGLWAPSRKELVIKPIEWGDKREQREHTLKVMRHEAFHQYAFYAFDQNHLCPWINEGFAKFFENAEIARGRFSACEDERALKEIETVICKPSPALLQRLLEMSYAEFYAKDGTDEQRSFNYHLAWAFIYYLQLGIDPRIPTASPNGIARAYTDQLKKTRDPRAATQAILNSPAFPKIVQDFAAFWDSKNRRSAARRRTFQLP